MPSLVETILATEAALTGADVPHAFGGALALAFHIEEPRGTRDIDVNVFVAPDRVDEVFAALPAAVAHSAADAERVRRDGQVRLFWDDTPLDLFFTTHAFHDVAEIHVDEVPFAGTTIPVLGATELLVFKAFFDRTKDWADIEAIVETGTADLHTALGWLVDLLGPEDPRVARLR
ncbi:MAG: hypothetical protein ACXVK4_17340, partial [Acidimicrobiia bacterium]